jgi:hypothetical protein
MLPPPQCPEEMTIDKLNPRYFGFIDEVVALAASMDITVAIVPTWGRYLNGGLAAGRSSSTLAMLTTMASS